MKFRRILKKTLEKIDGFYMQTEVDCGRIAAIGADSEKITAAGNLKFDIELQNYSEEEKNELKEIILSDGRKIFVAGSTRTGEDEIIIDAFSHLRDYMLVIVPRHLERTGKNRRNYKKEKFFLCKIQRMS